MSSSVAIAGLLSSLNPFTILLCALGVIIGIIFGSIPGLTSTMAVALCLPITYGMGALNGIAMLIALYVGGTSGGLISAILLKIPGTPSSVATTFDGAPMAEHGQAGKALGVGILYSFLGTVISIVALIFIAPQLARVALKFGPQEYFAICLFALTMIGSMAGDNIWKGLFAGIMGITFSLFGISDVGGVARFTFGSASMENGFSQLPLMIGLFAVSEVIMIGAETIDSSKPIIKDAEMHGFGVSMTEFKDQFVNFIRSALIGIGIGILPGIGGATSNILAYTVARQQSKHPEKFGTGIIDGLIASETSNNAAIGGALIPMLTLGIPGDTVTAILLGGLTLHGITPGPMLFQNSGELVYGVFGAFIVSTILMLIIEYSGIKMFTKVLSVPKYILLPVVLVLCIVGTYGTNHLIFDVWTAIGFGILGYFMSTHHIPKAPMILGFVLGGIVETNLVRGLMYCDGDFLGFFKSPIAAVFMLVSVVVVVMTAWKEFKKSSKAKV